MASILLPKSLECKNCSKSFEPKRRDQKYCSKECSTKIFLPDLKGETLICPLCENKVLKTRRDQIYCSAICRNLYNLKKMETVHIPKRIFEGTREEIVDKLEQYLEDKGYFENK